jgi:hypothetical protein
MSWRKNRKKLKRSRVKKCTLTLTGGSNITRTLTGGDREKKSKKKKMVGDGFRVILTPMDGLTPVIPKREGEKKSCAKISTRTASRVKLSSFLF